jgi:hypothetical protein
MKDYLLASFFRAYCALVVFLCRIGAPPWLVDAVRPCFPDALMWAATHAHLRCRMKQAARTAALARSVDARSASKSKAGKH